MALPDSRIQADFTEKPIATKRRASDGCEMLDVNLDNATITLPAGISTSALQNTQITAEQAILAKLADPATQTTLAAILAKLISAPATSAKQDTLLTELQLKADLTEFQPVKLYDSQIAKYSKIDPMRQMAVVEPVRLVGTSFTGTTKDTNFWEELAGGGIGAGTNGSVAQAGQITLSSGTKTDAYTEYKSIRRARYVTGSANFFRSVIRLPDAGQATNIRRWGAFTTATRVPTDGAWFQLNGTDLGIAYVKNGGAPTVVTATDIALTKDTNAHAYEIWWTNSKIWFFVDDVLKHTVSATTAPWSYMGAFNTTLQNINSGNITSVDLECRAASIYRFGHIATSPTFKNITTGGGYPLTTVCKYGAGVLMAISVNSPTATSNTAIVYNNTSAAAPIIGTFEMKNGMGSYEFGDNGIPFDTGLTVVTSSACDITVVYE